VTTNEVPALALAAVVADRCVVLCVTFTEPDVPVIDEVVVSVAVTCLVPAEENLTLKLPTPPENVESAGSMAPASFDVKCTVPAYVVAIALLLSSAVTVTVTELPTVALAGALTEKWVAAAAFATPPARNEIGTATSAAAAKRA
jgi:hypothetical protein